MSKKYLRWMLIVLGGGLLIATLWGPIVSNVEQPKYQVVVDEGHIEIRDYAAMIVAETEVTGDRRKAISKGFRRIADYIFGNNTTAQKVPMTSPVTQQDSEKIAMTAPVTQQSNGKTWTVRLDLTLHAPQRSEGRNTCIAV
jgi:SOUL heme-binding protein